MFKALAKFAATYYVAQAVIGIVVGLYLGAVYPERVMEFINAAH